jgi:glyoxylate reductase
MIRAAGHEVEVPGVDEPLDRREMLRLIRGCDGVVTQLAERVDGEVFDAAGPGLRVVSNYAVGFNNIDVAEATRRGITVCNTPGVLTEATADITWALILAVARRVAEGDAMVRRGQWTGWAPSQLLGGDLMGRTLVIVGAGRIGYAVARRGARGWDMPVVYVSREKKPDWERTLGARRMELEEALAVGDVVSLHTPLTEATRYLLDGRRLGMMKRSAYLVNTARGPVVDEAALVVALREGKIAGAGLDVYEREPELAAGLAGCDNAVLLPHLGSATHGTRAAMSDLAARNLLAVLRGDQPPHAVNPDVGGTRKPRD